MASQKLLMAMVVLAVIGTVSTTNLAMAMIVKLNDEASPSQYYRPQDPCFDPTRGYSCTPVVSSFEQLLPQLQPEVPDNSESQMENSDFEEINNYLW